MIIDGDPILGEFFVKYVCLARAGTLRTHARPGSMNISTH